MSSSATVHEVVEREVAALSVTLGGLLRQLETEGRASGSGYEFLRDTKADIDYLPHAIKRLFSQPKRRRKSA